LRDLRAAVNHQTGKETWRFWTIPAGAAKLGSERGWKITWRIQRRNLVSPFRSIPSSTSVLAGGESPAPDPMATSAEGDNLY